MRISPRSRIAGFHCLGAQSYSIAESPDVALVSDLLCVMMFSVWPKSSLIDDITTICVSKLDPLQKVTLAAKVVGDNGGVFESHAHFIADEHGQVDVGRDPSVGGSYSGVSAMGLLWSMKPAPGQIKGLRLIKHDVTKPYVIELKCFNDHIASRETSKQPMALTTFLKGYMADGVRRIPVKEGRIRGTLFLPLGNGPFPGNLKRSLNR